MKIDLSNKHVNRSVLKNEKVTVKMKEPEQVNPLHHKNIHFKKEYDKDKKDLFFS